MVRPVNGLEFADKLHFDRAPHVSPLSGLAGEEDDTYLLVESAVLGCSMLLTSDEHLRGIDFQCLTFGLQSFDVIATVIATPREIVAKFF